MLYYNLSLVFKFHYHDGPFLFYFEPNACRIEMIDWLIVVLRQVSNWQLCYGENNLQEVCFTLDQHPELDCYSASWLKQQSTHNQR